MGKMKFRKYVHLKIVAFKRILNQIDTN